MQINRLSGRDWAERIILAVLFAAMGLLIIYVFSPLRPVLAGASDYLGRAGLMAILLAGAVLLRRSAAYHRFWPVVFGLFTLAAAVSASWVFGIYVIEHLGVSGTSPQGYALIKLNEGVVAAGVVILLTVTSGSRLGSIYLQKGNLKLGLTIGLIAFLLAVAGAVPMSMLMFKGKALTLSNMTPWIPWLLVFVLANAVMEEVMFRGLFLQKLEPFYGRFTANFLIAFVFTGLHGGVTYPADQYLFLAIVFPLALVWGYITQKTGAVWGSILFHAGTDIPLLLGIFSNLA